MNQHANTQYGAACSRNGDVELTYPVYGIRFEDPDVAVLARKVLKVSMLMAVRKLRGFV